MKTIKSLLFSLLATLMLSSCGYNDMVQKQENVESAWAQVENVYQRRADLIPNLVASVKGAAAHEQNTLTAVIEARAKATSISIDASNLTEENLAQFQQAQAGLSSALSRLMAVSEAYPTLQANENFRDLNSQLEGTENRITVERQKFNEAAKDYNTYIRQFPHNLVAMIFSFSAKPYFKAEAGSNVAPKVSFD